MVLEVFCDEIVFDIVAYLVDREVHVFHGGNAAGLVERPLRDGLELRPDDSGSAHLAREGKVAAYEGLGT